MNIRNTGYDYSMQMTWLILHTAAANLLSAVTSRASQRIDAATKCDTVLIPPGYGHVTINPSDKETLVMANLVSTAFESEYAFYERMHGAAWYELAGNIQVR